MPNPFTGEKYWYEQDNQSSLPMSTRENPTPSLPVNNPVANRNAVPQGSLQGTMTQPQKQGSLTDFAKVMRVISETAYKDRQKKEGKVLKGQFDPTKVSGSIFQQIMGAVEAKRGGDISKIYGGAVEAAKFDLQQKADQEAKAQELALAQQKIEEDKRQYNLTYYQTNGEFPPEVGSMDGFSGATQINGIPWRTDRNNNPIAAAVKVGGQNQFTKALDAAGIQWNYGSKFEDDPSMCTIKIDGDPIEAARVILANTNAIQGWYYNASSGKGLRETGVTDNEKFKALSPDEQNKIITEIYKGEAGNGSLVQSINGGNAQVNDKLQGWAILYQKDPTTAVKTIPAAKLPQVQAIADKMPPVVTEMGKEALKTAEDLMNKFEEGAGTIAVGGSRFWGGGGLIEEIPGTDAANFANKFQSLKDKLSLDAVKYLKGQGQVSDAERAMLANATTELKLTQSEDEFKKTLQGIIDKLRGGSIITAPDGQQIIITD